MISARLAPRKVAVPAPLVMVATQNFPSYSETRVSVNALPVLTEIVKTRLAICVKSLVKPALNSKITAQVAKCHFQISPLFTFTTKISAKLVAPMGGLQMSHRVQTCAKNVTKIVQLALARKNSAEPAILVINSILSI